MRILVPLAAVLSILMAFQSAIYADDKEPLVVQPAPGEQVRQLGENEQPVCLFGRCRREAAMSEIIRSQHEIIANQRVQTEILRQIAAGQRQLAQSSDEVARHLIPRDIRSVPELEPTIPKDIRSVPELPPTIRNDIRLVPEQPATVPKSIRDVPEAQGTIQGPIIQGNRHAYYVRVGKTPVRQVSRGR